METDSPKVAVEDDSSTMSAVSSTSEEPKGKLGRLAEVPSNKDACEGSGDKDTDSGSVDKCSVSQNSRSPSPVGNDSSVGEDSAVEGPGQCDESETGARVKVESDPRHSSDADVLGDQDSVCDIKDTSKDPNLLHKSEEPKTEPSSEELLSGGEVKAKCEELKTESSVKHCVEYGESEPSDRKRSALEDSEQSNPKRSRLDLVIGKLGSQIGISPENIKCDESMFDSDIESGKTSSDSTENRSEEVTSEDDETASKTSCKRLTEEVSLKMFIDHTLSGEHTCMYKNCQFDLNVCID